MDKKYIVLIAFALVVIAQLYAPASMILEREDILTTGKEYKFKTAPIDPTDPFRGKYLILNYDETTFPVAPSKEWSEISEVFVLLTTDKDGFAKIKSVSKSKPDNNLDFVKAYIDYYEANENPYLSISYPFDRFYMEESKAYEAEVAYNESQVDSNQVAYALVNIKDGEAVLKDVMLDGVSIKEVVKSRLEFKKD